MSFHPASLPSTIPILPLLQPFEICTVLEHITMQLIQNTILIVLFILTFALNAWYG